MGTIRKRNDSWQAQIRRAGEPAISRSFTTRTDAARWIRQMETRLDGQSLPQDFSLLERTTLKDILVRYRDEIVPHKRSAQSETAMINAFIRHPLARKSMRNLKPSAFAAYRDQRLKRVKPASLSRELGIVQHAIDVARKEWEFPIEVNPLTLIRKPKIQNARERRLAPEEEARLLAEVDRLKNPSFRPLIILALETAMRRSELISLKWVDINFQTRTIHIPRTKNGYPRTIPMTMPAVNTLESLKTIEAIKPLPLTPEAIKSAWRRLLARTGIHDLHFHDLRHEAISRFFEMGLTLPEVALISGHRDPRMLFRYTHMKAEHVIKKFTENE